MGGLDVIRIRQIGNRACHAQHPMPRACREVQLLDGGCQQVPIGRSESAVAFDVLRREVLIGAATTMQLAISGARGGGDGTY